MHTDKKSMPSKILMMKISQYSDIYKKVTGN